MLDNIVANEKTYRLEKEHEGRVEHRRNHLAELYTRTAKAHVSPAVAPFLPSLTILQNLPLFHGYLHDRGETVADMTVVPDAEGVIQRFVTSVIRDKKQYLVQMMANAGVVAIADGHSTDDILKLATALFQCCNAHSRVFIGWDEAGVRTNPPRKRMPKDISNPGNLPLDFPCKIVRGAGDTLVASEYGVDLNCKFAFSTFARDALKEIAVLLDVDWRVVPAKTLDALDKRFVCKTCPFRRKNGAYGLDAMDWRECVRIPP